MRTGADDTMVDDLRPGAWSAPTGPPAEQGAVVPDGATTTVVGLIEPIEPATPTLQPIDQSALNLPPVAVTRPPAQDDALSGSLSYLNAPATPARRKKQRRPGRAIAILLVLGGLGTAGAVYGPALYEDYVGEEEPAEPTAPLAFPIARPGATQVRTATFEIDDLSTGSDATYTITVDFETWVSRVVIDRPENVPDLEVLTFSDDALVRRLDSESWYQIDRGSFPFDDQLQRTDWIRAVDDLLPTDQRAGITIETATESVVAGVTTRHLVLSLDPGSVRLSQSEPLDALDPIADIASAAGGDTAAEAPTSAPTSAPTPALVDQPADGTTSTTVELWIDDRGMIRRSAGASVLGIRDTTILDTSDIAWVPEYPDVSQVSPMTAGALLELGL